MAVTNKMYIAGSSTVTDDFASFFNEIKEIFIDMGHTYVEDESDAYKHVFKLDPSKYVYCGYEAKLTITLNSTIYNYLITDSLPTSASNNELTYLYYTIELSNGYKSSSTAYYRIFSTSNSYADFLNGNIPRYQSFREIQTDNIYEILIYSGAIQYSSLPFFSYYNVSSGYMSISSAKYIDFNTGEEKDMSMLLGDICYLGPNMIQASIITPTINSTTCKKILNSPLWISKSSSSMIDGYVKDVLITSTIEPYSKYKINDVIYIPVDRSQHFLVKETSTTT